MEGECYYITHLGISDKFYTIVAGPTSAESLLLLSLRGLVHRTKEEAVGFADDLLAPGIEEIQIMSGAERSTRPLIGRTSSRSVSSNPTVSAKLSCDMLTLWLMSSIK